MPRMKIGTRLIVGFGVVVGLTIVLGLFSLDKHAALQRLTEQMDRRDFLVLGKIQSIIRTEDEMRLLRQSAISASLLQRERVSGVAPESAESQWLQNRDASLKLLTELQASAARFETDAVSSTRGDGWRRVRRSARDATEALRAISPEVERQFQLINSGAVAQAAQRISQIEALVRGYRDQLDAAERAVEDQIQMGRSEMTQIAVESRQSIIVVLLLSVVAASIFAFLIHRSITTPLNDFMQVVERVGQGDLTVEVASSSQDEIGDLGRSLSRMVKGLKDLSLQTRGVVENLNSATAEILASTQQQAASTAEQAAAVQQANATLAEISQSGAQISERAKQVATAAEATSSASAAGLQSVRNTTLTMEAIREQAEAVAENVIALSEKTQAISEIITTVNGIAEQSHLLALNAAIQAAVAGANGRSFAVVAREMQNLAAQSKQATVQVRSILGDIQKGITSSVMLTEEAVKRAASGRQQASIADETIRGLTENIEESIRAFQQIVGGSGQQQIGFEQVSQAFRSIGTATHETALSTKQSEKAIANLSELAQQLRAAVEKYRL